MRLQDAARIFIIPTHLGAANRRAVSLWLGLVFQQPERLLFSHAKVIVAQRLSSLLLIDAVEG